MTMKYVRVVLAVEEEDLPSLYNQLDEFIEDGDFDDEKFYNPVQGAYVSTPYDTRDDALHLYTFTSHKEA